MKFYASLLFASSIVSLHLTAVDALKCLVCKDAYDPAGNCTETKLLDCEKEETACLIAVIKGVTRHGCGKKGDCQKAEECKKGKCEAGLTQEIAKEVESCDECYEDGCRGSGMGAVTIALIAVAAVVAVAVVAVVACYLVRKRRSRPAGPPARDPPDNKD